MKIRLCIVLLATAMSVGCVATLRFYPVQGPLFAAKPVPVLFAKISGLSSGNISLVLNDGEVCKGQWAMVPINGTGAMAPNGTLLDTGDMSPFWDSIYGQGFYKSHILGSRFYARAIANGKKGATINIELYKADIGDIKGVAKDSNGNVYKVQAN